MDAPHVIKQNYVGEFKKGQKDGKGKLRWADGSWYEGEFK